MKLGIEKAVWYIDENLTDNFSLTDVARYCNYSPYHLSVLFQQTVGDTIKGYTKKRRLTRAAEALRNTDMKIIDISMQYGYSSQAAFSRAFMDMFGLTPRQYRQAKAPVQAAYRKSTPVLYGNGTEAIKTLQDKIEASYEVAVLHVLNGMQMLSRFERDSLMRDNQTYVAFNEAMCWGEADTAVFSAAFVEKRVESLKTTAVEYRSRVLGSLKPLLEAKFDIIVLWFGDDMFCQMNMITLLAYLEQSGYKGDVLFCMALETIDDFLADAFEIDAVGYSNIYKTVICRHEMPGQKVMPVTYQAIRMYLNYQTEESPIIKYIRGNLTKERLVTDLLARFPAYGLGDLQYQAMIDAARS
ncbi:MAG: AraC family transcriptional regulator [Sporomusaceae bacterium]|nr:AraC family transcriptional regulator [Sporomusaceae bacterium]